MLPSVLWWSKYLDTIRSLLWYKRFYTTKIFGVEGGTEGPKIPKNNSNICNIVKIFDQEVPNKTS